MIVGFTGTRVGMTPAQLDAFKELVATTRFKEFHHGSCMGADVEAARIVRRFAEEYVYIVCHPGPADDSCQQASGVDDEIREPLTHFRRNRNIVSCCDLLVATPKESIPQNRGGTWYTINYAHKLNKPVKILGPGGDWWIQPCDATSI